MSSQLRSFKAYGVSSVVVGAVLTNGAIYGSGINFPCQFADADGFYRGVGGEWLQVFDANALPGNGTVPLKSIALISQNNGQIPSLYEVLGPITFLTGCVFAISSTEATLTISASLMDLWGEIEEFEIPVAGLSITGDLTTNVTSRTIWNAGSTVPNQPVKNVIFRIDVKGTTGDGSTNYLQLFTAGLPNPNMVPIMQWTIVDNTVTAGLSASPTGAYAFSFGDTGLVPISQTSASPPVVTTGCRLFLSTTSGFFTAPTSQTMTLRVQWKTVTNE